MNQGLIPHRYARALYKVALERNCTKELYAIMKTLAKSFADNPELGRVMENPFVSAAEKKSLLLTASGLEKGAGDTAAATFGDFTKLLDRNRRLDFMRGIALAYIGIYRMECNIATVTVTSASPLGDDATRRLKEIIHTHSPEATIEYSEKVDPSLIGGFTIAIDNQRLDASVKNELKQLRLKLLSH